MNYYDHQQEAIAELKSHIMNCKHSPKDGYTCYDEAKLAEEDLLEEGQQIRFLSNGVLKIKWEAPCSWVGCHWHLYYCKLAEPPVFKEIQEVLH